MAKSRNAGELNPMYGKQHTEEARKKMSAAHFGKPCPPRPATWRENLSNARKGLAAGNKNPMWNGGIKHDRGYLKIHVPGHPYADRQGYVYEHRLVLEKKFGRYLTPSETPHHINGNRSDNRPENLELYTNHGEHTVAAHIERNAKGQFCKKAAGRLFDGREWNELPTGVKQ